MDNFNNNFIMGWGFWLFIAFMAMIILGFLWA